MHKTKILPMAINVTNNETRDKYTQKSGREIPPARVSTNDKSCAINIAKKMIRALQKSGKKVCSPGPASDLFLASN